MSSADYGRRTIIARRQPQSNRTRAFNRATARRGPGLRAQQPATATAHKFSHEIMRLELAVSSLKNGVDTLLGMLALADADGYTTATRAQLAAQMGISERTVIRHWKAAREQGYLRSEHYSQSAWRASDHWLTWPGRVELASDPGIAELAKAYLAGMEYPAGPTIQSSGPMPF